MPDKVFRSFLGERLIFNAFNFAFNILLLHYVAEEYGYEIFAYYSFVLAIPSFLVFADLGLGVVVFHYFNASKSSQNINRSTQVRLVTNSVLVLSVSSFLMMLVSLFITFKGSWFFLFGILNNHEHIFIYSAIVSLIFMSQIPALAHDILTATGRASTSMRIIFANSFTNFLFVVMYVNSEFHSIKILLIFPALSQMLFALLSAYCAELHKFILFKIHMLDLKFVLVTIRHGLVTLVNLTTISLILQFPRFSINHNGNNDQIFEITRIYILLIPICALMNSFVWVLVAKIDNSKKYRIIGQALITCFWILGFSMVATSMLSQSIKSLPSISSFLPAALVCISYSLVCTGMALRTDYGRQRDLMLVCLLFGSLLTLSLYFGTFSLSILQLMIIQTFFLIVFSSILLKK